MSKIASGKTRVAPSASKASGRTVSGAAGGRAAVAAKTTGGRRGSGVAAQPVVKRPRGRPPQRSVQVIIDKTMELLAARPPEDISMALVAESLGIPTMSLYNYFPNHAALLNAVGDYAFSLFRFPKSQLQKPWREALLAWLWAVDRHFERHPVATKMMTVEGHISVAWTKVQEPLLQIMAGLGLRGRELTFALCWFTSQAIGLMLIETSAHSSRQLKGHPQSAPDSAVAEQVLRELARYKPGIRRQDVLDFGFRGIIDSLERLLPHGKGLQK